MRPPNIKECSFILCLQAFAIVIFKNLNGRKYKLSANKFASTLPSKKQRVLNICQYQSKPINYAENPASQSN